MARRRFSDLQKVNDALALGKVDVNTLPPNLDFVKYAKWKRGDTTRTIATRPALNGEVIVGVIAFGIIDTDADAKILVTMTGRSKSAVDGISGAAAALGYTTTLTNYDTNGSFVPAKARIALRKTATAEVSDITGRKYKDSSGSAYTSPMGQTSTKKYFKDSIDTILALTPFAGSNRTHSISFSPEQFRRD